METGRSQINLPKPTEDKLGDTRRLMTDTEDKEMPMTVIPPLLLHTMICTNTSSLIGVFQKESQAQRDHGVTTTEPGPRELREQAK